MLLNSNESLNEMTSINISSIEIILLYIISAFGIIINLLIMIYLLLISSYRMKSSCFLFHHCIICFVLSMLCLPYSLSFSKYSIRCDYLGNIQVTCVTAQLLNIAAMVASEAYRFEDLIHQDNNSLFKTEIKQSNKSTISCGCLSFGILIIWFSSIILHLGITMIGSESKSYYDENSRSCNFVIRDIRGYVLTLMWIIITIFSLIITIRYILKILREVSRKREHNKPLLSLTIIGQSHGQSIASKDILMQQIQQRIKLNILLIVLFIIFWFPLFILTLSNIKLKIEPQILRHLLLLAWSNASISPLSYCLFLSKCVDRFGLCWTKDRSTTYDSLTSYYNRIGDRFHDIGKSNLNQFQLTNQSNKEFLNKTKDNSKQNSLLVREISFNRNDDETSSLSSLTNVTFKQNSFSNGLIVTSSKKTNF